MFKKYLPIFLLFIIIMFSGNGQLLAQNFDINVRAAILIDADTGQVLYEKNADQELPPASITKIMTLLVAYERVENNTLSLNDEVTISNYASSMGGSQLYLPANAKIELKELFKAVSISSANDASVALAEAAGGNYSHFIELMNEKTEELGMNNTNFVNSTGLPEADHYSTARDIAKMSRELVKYDQILEWTSIWVDYLELPDREAMMANTNKLVNKYAGLDGLRTGYTSEAGYCLAATAKRSDTRLISVIMGAESDTHRQEASTRLLDYGFNNFSRREIVSQGQEIQNIDIKYGSEYTTTGEAEEDLSILVKRGADNELVTELNLMDREAPIEKGEIIGQKEVYQNNIKVGQVNILATQDINRVNIFIQLWRSFVNWIGSWLQNI